MILANVMLIDPRGISEMSVTLREEYVARPVSGWSGLCAQPYNHLAHICGFLLCTVQMLQGKPSCV